MKTKKQNASKKEDRTTEKKMHPSALDDKDEEKRNHRIEKKITPKDKQR